MATDAACGLTGSDPLEAEEPTLGAPFLAQRAVAALLAEAELTPKPGLVDRRGSGAHSDMDLPLMRRSASALRPTFEAIAEAAAGRNADAELREELGRIGREGEAVMLAATGGRNTHRGAIWSLGLLTAAAALTAGSAELPPGAWARARLLAGQAGGLARLPDRHRWRGDSHGVRMELRYGARGAVGEAEEGFPHVLRFGLAALWAARARGIPESSAQLDALLAIMAELEDTCLLQRGGPEALRAARRGARAVLRAGGAASESGRTALEQLDRALTARRASPGGGADLLAATLFVDGWARATDLPLWKS
jgi:triphosphoribosyl-dephospho-CoA synthase